MTDQDISLIAICIGISIVVALGTLAADRVEKLKNKRKTPWG